MICTNGWWEQPESARTGSNAWTFHPTNLGEASADMVVYDLNGDQKADIIDSSAHKFGMWWFEQGAPKDGNPAFARHDTVP